jgi:hypothetical protein
LLSNFQVSFPLRGVGSSRGKNRNKTLEFSPGFEHKQLLFDLDFCDPKSVAS